MATIDYTDRRRARLDVEFYFAAAHRLPRYDGPCFRMHGHNYRMFVAVEGEIDPHTGMIADFGKIQEIVKEHVLSRADFESWKEGTFRTKSGQRAVDGSAAWEGEKLFKKLNCISCHV